MFSLIKILAFLSRSSASSIRGNGYRSFFVKAFSFRKSTQNLRPPFGFLAKRIGEIKGA